MVCHFDLVFFCHSERIEKSLPPLLLDGDRDPFDFAQGRPSTPMTLLYALRYLRSG
jgi:hypothetical protein